MSGITGNPRTYFGGKHRERGPARYTYTIHDLAKVSELSVETLRTYHHHGKLDLNDFASVVAFLVDRAHK